MIEPFTARVPDADLADLRRRLAGTRWAPERPAGAEDGAYGVPLARLRRMVARWQELAADIRRSFRPLRPAVSKEN
jgi:hypothetical protein